MTFSKRRFLWRAFKARYRDEAAELSALKRRAGPGAIVCDIGANKGSYLYWLSRWTPGGRMVAFEPQPALAEYLAEACRALKLGNVTVEAKAVGAHSGMVELYVPGGESPEASLGPRITEREDCRLLTVPATALDDYFAPGERVAALKIDVEGAEASVFEGAQRILTEQSPLLVFECEARHLADGAPKDVFARLERLGYRGRFVYQGTLRPLDDFDLARHQSQEGDRFWDAKGYCNNFVFEKDGAEQRSEAAAR